MESISAANAAKFYWMRMPEKGRTVSSEEGTKVKIPGKALFGVREVRGRTYDEILLVDGTRFTLSIKKSEALMDGAKPFKGKTPTVARKVSTPKPVTIVPASATTPIKVLPVARVAELFRKPIVHIDTRKPTKITTTPVKDKTKPLVTPTVKRTETELPEVDDFYDHEIPEEFRRFKKVESTGVTVEQISISLEQPKS